MTQTVFQFNAPYVRNSETSRAAAEAITPSVGTLRYKLLCWLREHGPATDEEMQDGVPMAASTRRPRRGELVAAGLVVDSGHERKTRSGRWAVVWTCKGGGT